MGEIDSSLEDTYAWQVGSRGVLSNDIDDYGGTLGVGFVTRSGRFWGPAYRMPSWGGHLGSKWRPIQATPPR